MKKKKILSNLLHRQADSTRGVIMDSTVARGEGGRGKKERKKRTIALPESLLLRQWKY